MKTFLISDHHWGHSNILTFKRHDGSPLRQFGSCVEMDEYMIECWNKTISPIDKVYHLGDVCFHNRVLDAILPRLNGSKILIKGNHDNLEVSQYMKYFKDIRAYDRLDTFVLSHIPIHQESISNKTTANIHGHTHYRCLDDTRYFNVSVEARDYFPVDFESIRSYYKNGN